MIKVTSSPATSNPRLRPPLLMKNLTCHLSCLEGPRRRPSLLLKTRITVRVITIMDRKAMCITPMLIMGATSSPRVRTTTMAMAILPAKPTLSRTKTRTRDRIKTMAQIISRILTSTSSRTRKHLPTTSRRLTIVMS